MITEKIITDLNKIYNHFGREVNYKKIFEEIGELTNSDIGSENEKEEFADVWIPLTQKILNDKEIQKYVISKIKRTLDRIESGYYK